MKKIATVRIEELNLSYTIGSCAEIF